MSVKKRVVSLFLCFVLGASMMASSVPAARAVELPDRTDISEYIMRVTMTVTGVAGFDFPTGVVRMDTLESVRDIYNDTLAKLQRGSILPIPDFTPTPWDLLGPAVITEEGSSGVARLIDSKNNVFITDEWGNYPYCYVAGDVPAEDIAVENVHANKWFGLTERSPEVETVTQDALATAVIELNDAGIDCSLVKGYYNEILYYFICTPDYKYYCNSKGEMFVAPAEASATDLNRPYIDDDGNPLDIDKILDLDNNTLNLPGDNGLSLELSIGNISYDDGDKSYTVNAYTTINEGDEYYYTYYTYNVQYNITNTYITYIGSNEPYEREEYELYYELPDGRSSADLTAEEIAGMSFEFYDVVNYQRSTDDVSVRALYHFDGNIEDSSYFTGQGSFVWNDGASITYMESPSPFEGNLYLDNTAHSFNIGLPSSLGTGDFTIQFRYYQASEPDTLSNIENIISVPLIGELLAWDEQNLYSSSSGSVLSALPVGTWNEIALVRSNGILYIYLNGLCVGSVDKTNISFPRELNFSFGATSRAYTMLDELRILNIAVAEDGASYAPTVVPHDSNLVLVLPDSKLPIADAYYSLAGTGDNLLGYDFTTFTSGVVPAFSPLAYNSSNTSFTAYSDGVTLTRLTTTNFSGTYSSFSSTVYGNPCSGLYQTVASLGLSTSTAYTLSIVLSDGSVYSMPFTTQSSTANSSHTTAFNSFSNGYSGTVYNQLDFPGGSLVYGRYIVSMSNYQCPMTDYLIIRPTSTVGSTLDIMYIELVKGSGTDLVAEKVTSVYSGIDLQPNTAAIQTTIPVNGYTVGGVRPSMPAKGDLWFPVMENRITGVQIYAGTHWEEVNARWWTGSRWIPIYAFDINTLEDLFDIADGDGVVSLLPDTNSFFRWWQLQWLDFRQWLDGRLSELIAVVGGGGEGIDTEIPDDGGNVKFSPLQLIDTILSGLLEIAKEVIVEFVGLVVDLFKMFIQSLLDFVGGLVDVLSSGLTHFSTLSDGLSGIGNFVSGTYDAIPDDIQGVLTSSFVVIISVSLLAFLL